MREFLMREFAEGVDQEEYRSSGVQEFSIFLNLELS
jgi:hypothetical protein